MAIQDSLHLQTAVHSAHQGQARHALVTAVDPTNHSVKVTLQPEGVVTGWLPDPGMACGGLRICCPCEVGTQVLTVPVEGDSEHPVVVARLFDTTILPPTSPGTGKPVQPGEVGFFLANGVYLHLSNDGLFINGTLKINGSVEVTGDVTSQSISLIGHVHGGVSTGSQTTNVPEAG